MNILCNITQHSHEASLFCHISITDIAIWCTNLILGLAPSFCALEPSSCCWSCLSSSDLVICLSKGRESATAEAAATNSGLRDSLLKENMEDKWEKRGITSVESKMISWEKTFCPSKSIIQFNFWQNQEFLTQHCKSTILH